MTERIFRTCSGVIWAYPQWRAGEAAPCPAQSIGKNGTNKYSGKV